MGSRFLIAFLVVLAPEVAAAGAFLEEVATESGIDFVHFNGMTGDLYFAEMMGAGAALFDADGDGDLDVFFVQGDVLDERGREAVVHPPDPSPPGIHRLYRNDTVVAEDGSRNVRFTDVTEESGLGAAGYGMGVATGDYDNDGDVDLYVTALGPNQLFRNRGDGTFEDVTEASGTGERRWSVPALFFDADGDGWLDLWVGNYVDFRVATHKSCSSSTGIRDYCSPSAFSAETDRLFRNRGDGTFEDVTVAAGLDRAFGPALGGAAADFDGDGRIDLSVANDGAANQLWLRREDGTYEDVALFAGCAVNADGQPEASMGVVADDFDGDGSTDLFMTHLERETNTLYLNDGSGLFEDATVRSGLGMASWKNTGFGTALADFDGDGILDLFVANGAVTILEPQLRAGSPLPLGQPNQLAVGEGKGRFRVVDGPWADEARVGRGVAAGDVDDDGDVDLLVANNAGPAELWLNTADPDDWIGLRLLVAGGTRLDHEARATLVGPNGPVTWRTADTDGSYASAGDPRIVFAPADPSAVEAIRVRWSDGAVEDFEPVAPGRYVDVERGTGSPVP